MSAFADRKDCTPLLSATVKSRLAFVSPPSAVAVMRRYPKLDARGFAYMMGYDVPNLTGADLANAGRERKAAMDQISRELLTASGMAERVETLIVGRPRDVCAVAVKSAAKGQLRYGPVDVEGSEFAEHEPDGCTSVYDRADAADGGKTLVARHVRTRHVVTANPGLILHRGEVCEL